LNLIPVQRPPIPARAQFQRIAIARFAGRMVSESDKGDAQPRRTTISDQHIGW
jgi:hypothetical protein